MRKYYYLDEESPEKARDNLELHKRCTEIITKMITKLDSLNEYAEVVRIGVVDDNGQTTKWAVTVKVTLIITTNPIQIKEEETA